WGAFYKSANLGRLTLWQVFGVPMELMAGAIVLMALAAFYLAGLGEKWAPYDKQLRVEREDLSSGGRALLRANK
ncbi:MAG: hypothetical protein LDL33_08875, partial [Desulfomonile sp.]|nr:hypothetical protein [Desulfomonile sp.]